MVRLGMQSLWMYLAGSKCPLGGLGFSEKATVNTFEVLAQDIEILDF